jgi:hypothetical protein
MLTLAWFAGALLAAAAVASARNDASTTPAGAFPMNKDDPSAIAQACLQDLEAIPGFLRENDAGVQQPVSPETEDRRRAALEVARRTSATRPGACASCRRISERGAMDISPCTP